MTVYILSTMTNSINYRTYRYIGDSESNKGAGPLPVPEPGGILIRGGAGLPSLRSGFGETTEDVNGNVMWTPSGVVTPITDEQYDRLKDHWLFKKHLEKNLVKVITHDITGNHKEVKRQVAMDMQPQDNFAQLSKETIQQRIRVTIPTKEISEDGTPRM